LPELLPAPANLTPAELEAFTGMNDALRRKVVDIKGRLASEMQDFMTSRYALGQAVVSIRDDPDTYGIDSDMKIAAFFGDVGKTVLNEARRIVDRYPRSASRRSSRPRTLTPASSSTGGTWASCCASRTTPGPTSTWSSAWPPAGTPRSCARPSTRRLAPADARAPAAPGR
jgi:hypothetical protein